MGWNARGASLCQRGQCGHTAGCGASELVGQCCLPQRPLHVPIRLTSEGFFRTLSKRWAPCKAAKALPARSLGSSPQTTSKGWLPVCGPPREPLPSPRKKECGRDLRFPSTRWEGNDELSTIFAVTSLTIIIMTMSMYAACAPCCLLVPFLLKMSSHLFLKTNSLGGLYWYPTQPMQKLHLREHGFPTYRHTAVTSPEFRPITNQPSLSAYEIILSLCHPASPIPYVLPPLERTCSPPETRKKIHPLHFSK